MTTLVWEPKTSGRITQYIAQGRHESYCITNERETRQGVPYNQSYSVHIMTRGGRLLGEASTMEEAKGLAEAHEKE
jgi:hypothetical protein